MPSQDQLYEKYEDALLALLMDGLAEAHGKQAIEKSEQLQEDSTVALPEGMEQRHLKAIRKRFAKKNIRLASRYATKACGKLMMALGIVTVLFISAFTTSEAVRVSTLNLVVEVFGECTDFQFKRGVAEEQAPALTANWLPTGFTLTEQESNGVSIWMVYENSDGNFIQIECADGDGMVLGIDTEDATQEFAYINGNRAFVYQEDDSTQITWAIADRARFVVLVSNLADLDSLLHVAKEIDF